MKRIFCILTVVLVFLLCFCSCGTKETPTQETEYDRLSLTVIEGEIESVFDKVLTEDEVRALEGETADRAELLQHKKTLNEIRERILVKDAQITECRCELGFIDNQLCAVYVIHAHNKINEFSSATKDEGCILKSVLVK